MGKKLGSADKFETGYTKLLRTLANDNKVFDMLNEKISKKRSKSTASQIKILIEEVESEDYDIEEVESEDYDIEEVESEDYDIEEVEDHN